VKRGMGVIEVRPERCIDRLCSDMMLNRRNMRSRFRYTTISKIRAARFPKSRRKGLNWKVLTRR